MKLMRKYYTLIDESKCQFCGCNHFLPVLIGETRECWLCRDCRAVIKETASMHEIVELPARKHVKRRQIMRVIGQRLKELRSREAVT